MNYLAWQIVLDNHRSTLTTCKNLIKENRITPVISLLRLADKNIKNLEDNIKELTI